MTKFILKYIKSIGRILVAIGVFFIYMGFKVENHNLYLLIGGGIIALIGWLPIAIIDRKDENKEFKLHRKWKKDLLNNGIKLEVDLEKVQIKSNHYQKEVEQTFTTLDKYKAVDTLLGKDTREFAEINECILIYETEVFGKKRQFQSSNIFKDKITLQFLLSNQKTTFIYLDKNDKDNYIFDIDFLNK